jgi:hypothetical protein
MLPAEYTSSATDSLDAPIVVIPRQMFTMQARIYMITHQATWLPCVEAVTQRTITRFAQEGINRTDDLLIKS